MLHVIPAPDTPVKQVIPVPENVIIVYVLPVLTPLKLPSL